MNKDLVNYTQDKEGEVFVPVLQKMFNRAILEEVMRSEILEILTSEKFLDIDRIKERLGFATAEVEKSISLLTILNFFDIDYLDVIRKRLRNLGISKYSLVMLFESIVYGDVCNDVLSIAEKVTGDGRFLFLLNKIEYIVPSFDYLLQIFDLSFEMFKTDEFDDELIEIVGGEGGLSTEKVLRFENFNG